MNYLNTAEAIIKELRECLIKTDETELSKAIHMIESADRIFLAGAGRSRLEAAAFAMRLMHIGFKSFLVGEVTTPSIKQNDLLVLCSGSGKTNTLIEYARVARECQAKILLFTASDNSELSAVSDQTVILHSKASKSESTKSLSSQPMSNLFAQSLCLTLDILIVELMNKNGLKESTMKNNHANLE